MVSELPDDAFMMEASEWLMHWMIQSFIYVTASSKSSIETLFFAEEEVGEELANETIGG